MDRWSPLGGRRLGCDNYEDADAASPPMGILHNRKPLPIALLENCSSPSQ